MKNKKGFTLIEILAVIIIMGIILIIAVPAVTKYIFKSDRQVYVSNINAYAETIRGKYEMKEYGDYLQEDEIMIVPIKSVILEKGDSENSPYGAYDFERSYIIIVPENNKYNFYATVIDETSTGLISTNVNNLDDSSIKIDIVDSVPTISSFEATGTIYKFKDKDYRKTENREIEGEDVNQEESSKVYVFKSLEIDPEPTNLSGIFKLTLNNNGATTAGTEFIYEYYSVGWYADSTGTTQIRTITPPYKNGYEFNGYYTTNDSTGKLIINQTGIIVSGQEKLFTTNGTLYAKWTECGNGYYSHNSLTCTQCPKGYRDGTTVANKTSESVCLKNVEAGKYVKNANDENVSTCSANTFKNAHTVTYGSTSTCPACTTLGGIYTKSAGGTGESGCYATITEGKYIKNAKDQAFSTCAENNYSDASTKYYGETSTCIPCVTLGIQYTKSAGGTGKTGCYMEVVAGKYKNTKTGITTANCAANKYSLKHNGYYNIDDNACTSCPSGYTSAEGSTAKSSCKIKCLINTRVTTADGKCTGSCAGGTTIAEHTISASNTSSACTTCTNGTGVYAWGSTGCTIASCKAGYAKNSNNTCTACTAGTTSNNGNTGACSACGNRANVASWSSGCNISSCNSGYRVLNNSCVKCDGWEQTSSGWVYYIDGNRINGWAKLGDGGRSSSCTTGGTVFWYYFENNIMVSNAWKYLPWEGSSCWYWFKGDGSMANNETVNINGTNYSFYSGGCWIDNSSSSSSGGGCRYVSTSCTGGCGGGTVYSGSTCNGTGSTCCCRSCK